MYKDKNYDSKHKRHRKNGDVNNAGKTTNEIGISDISFEAKNNLNYFSKFQLPKFFLLGRTTLINNIALSIDNNLFTFVYGRFLMGKTSSVCVAAQKTSKKFKYIFYFDLLSYSTIDEFSIDFDNLLEVLDRDINIETELPKLTRVMKYNSYLFIFDNIRENEQWFKYINQVQIASSNCDSRIVFICDNNIINFKNDQGRANIIFVGELSVDEIKELFLMGGITLQDTDARQILEKFNGLPAYIKVLVDYCQRFHFNSVQTLLSNDNLVKSGINSIILEQYEAVSSLSKDILFMLLILNKKSSYSKLIKYLKMTEAEYFSSIQELDDYNLILVNSDNIYLVSPIDDFLESKFISTVSQELSSNQFDFLIRYPLITTLSPNNIKVSQINLINKIIQHIKGTENITDNELYNALTCILTSKNNEFFKNNYLVGNLLNISSMLTDEISGLDLSGSYIINADLSNLELKNIDFSRATFDDTIFKSIFGSVTALRYNKDRNLFATGFFNGLILIWNENGEQVSIIQELTSLVFNIVFINDILFACSRDGNIICLNINYDYSYTFIKKINIGSSARAMCMQHNTNELIVGAEDGCVRKWNLNTDELKIIIKCAYRVKDLALSKDNLLAVIGDSNKVLFYRDNDLYWQVEVNNRWLRCGTFCADNTLVVGGDSGNINIISITEKSVSNINNVCKSKVWMLKGIPDTNIVACGGDDGTIKFWDIQTHNLLGIIKSHTSWVRGLDGSAEKLFSCGEDQIICIHDIKTLDCIKTIKGYTKRVFGIAISNNSGCYFGLGDHSVLKLMDHNRLRKLFNTKDQVWAITASDKYVCAGCDNSEVFIYDNDMERIVHTIKLNSGWIGEVKLDEEGSFLAVGDELGNITLVDMRNKLFALSKYKAHNGRVSGILFSSEAILSVGEDGYLNIYDKYSRSSISLMLSNMPLYSICAYDETTCLITSGDGSVYAVSHDDTIKTLLCLDSQIWTSCVTTSKMVLLGLDNGKLIISNIHGEIIHEIQEGNRQIWAVGFMERENQIVSAGEDGTIYFYDGEDFHKVKQIDCEPPYRNVNLNGCNGLSMMQINYLCLLGATEK